MGIIVTFLYFFGISFLFLFGFFFLNYGLKSGVFYINSFFLFLLFLFYVIEFFKKQKSYYRLFCFIALILLLNFNVGITSKLCYYENYFVMINFYNFFCIFHNVNLYHNGVLVLFTNILFFSNIFILEFSIFKKKNIKVKEFYDFVLLFFSSVIFLYSLEMIIDGKLWVNINGYLIVFCLFFLLYIYKVKPLSLFRYFFYLILFFASHKSFIYDNNNYGICDNGYLFFGSEKTCVTLYYLINNFKYVFDIESYLSLLSLIFIDVSFRVKQYHTLNTKNRY